MSGRTSILNLVANNKPAPVALPQIDAGLVIRYEDPVKQFKLVLESIGGKIIEVEDLQQLQQEIAEEKRAGSFVINTIEELGEIHLGLINLNAHELAAVEKAFIRGTLGVAENGAVWLYESNMINRLLPFICQHLVIILDRKSIVNTMHQAYDQIDIAKEGFGAFIAGPSKTADIEQSLVIGAHGARSLMVYLVN